MIILVGVKHCAWAKLNDKTWQVGKNAKGGSTKALADLIQVEAYERREPTDSR